MPDKNYITYTGYFALFIVLTVLYFLYNGFHAFHPTDDGFILANSWRIFNGEVPYKDFIYRFPPLTPYLHTPNLWLPADWQFLAGRFFAYAQMGLIMALPTIWAIANRRVRLNIFTLVLAVCFFAIAIQNNPPMPWYTNDGLMFGYLGLTLLLFSMSPARTFFWKMFLTVLASVSILLAALCKQPFLFAWLLIGIGLVISSLVHYKNSPDTWSKKRIMYLQLCYWGSGAAIAAGFFLWLIQEGTLDAFFTQVLSVGYFTDLINYGVLHYLRVAPVVFFLLGVVFSAFIFYGTRFTGKLESIYAILSRHFLSLILIVLVVLVVAFAFVKPIAIGPALFGFFLGAILMHGVLYFKRHNKSVYEEPAIFLYAGILIISWASSLSEGYNTPILGLGPAFLIIVIEMDRLGITGQSKSRLATGIVSIMCSIVILITYGYVNYTNPYRDLDRPQLTYNLAEIHPKFGGVYTRQLTYERFQEIEKLKAEYISDESVRYVIMPEFPVYYYIAGERNPVGLDWFIRTGGPNPELDSQVIDELIEKKPLVFLQKEFTTPVTWSKLRVKETDKWYTIPYWIAENWEKVGDGEYFDVYRAAK